MSDSHTLFASDEIVGSENAEQSGLTVLQPQLLQNRFAEGIGESWWRGTVVEVCEQRSGASRSEGDQFGFGAPASGWAVFFDHELVGILDIFLEFLQRGSLTDDPGHFTKLAHIPVGIFPVFQCEFCGSCRHSRGSVHEPR